MKYKNLTYRILSILLAAVMVCSMLPGWTVSAAAGETEVVQTQVPELEPLSNRIPVTPGQLIGDTGEIVENEIYGYVVGYELKKGHVLSISDENYVFSVRKLVNGNYSTMLKQATTTSFTANEDMTVGMLIRKPDKSALTAEELASVVIVDTLFAMTDVNGSVHRFTVEAETIDGGTHTTRAAIFLPDSYSEDGEPTRLVIMTNGYHGHLNDTHWNANKPDDVALMKHYMEVNYAVLVVDNTAEQTSYTSDAGCPQQVSGYFKAYEYVQEHFNLEELFSLHARSQGNLVALRIMREHPELIKCALMTGSQLSFKQVWDMVDTAFVAERFGFDDATGATYEADKVVGYDPLVDAEGIEYDLPPTFWMMAESDASTITLSGIEKIKAHGNDVTTKVYTDTDHSGVCRLNIDECWNDALAYLEVHQISDAEHRYCAWETVKTATCEQDGEMRRYCADCDHFESIVLDSVNEHVRVSGTDFCISCGAIWLNTLCTRIPVQNNKLQINGTVLEDAVYGHIRDYQLMQGHTLSISSADHVFSVRQLLNGDYSTTLKVPATADEYTAAADIIVGAWIRRPDSSELAEGELAGIYMIDSVYGMVDVAGYTHRFTVEAETIDGGTHTTRAAIFLPDSYSETGTPTQLIVMTNGHSAYLTDSIWNGNTANNVGIIRNYLNAGYAVWVVDNTAGRTSKTPDLGCPQLVDSYLKAYEYIQNHFNVEERFSIHSRSFGTFAAMRIMREVPELVKCAVMTGARVSLKQEWPGLDKAFIANRFGFEDTTGATYEADKLVGYDPYTDVDREEYALPPTYWVLCEGDATVKPLEVVEKLIAHGNDVSSITWTGTDHTGVCTLNTEEMFTDALAFLEEHQADAPTEPLWEQGTIASANGQNNASTTRLRTVDYLPLSNYSGASINTGFTLNNFVYDENYNYLGTSSWLGEGMPFTTAELQKKYPAGVYFRVVFRAVDQRKLTEADVAASGVQFYLAGEEVPAPDLGFAVEDIGNIGSWQDGAIWDGKLFALGATGTGAVFDVKTGARLASFTLDQKGILMPHANSVCFGSTYYAAGDKYPLLYVNIYNNYASAEDRMEGTCCVYRITESGEGFETDLVQVIRIGFTEDLTLWKSKENNGDVRPYGNFVVDTERSELYAFVMRDANKTTRFFSFDIPGLEEGTYEESYGCNVVTLEPDDIRAQFDSEHYKYLQGCCYSSGMILYMGDFGGDAPLYVVDLEEQKVTDIFCLGYAGARAEPEVLCADPADGTLYYAAADGVLRVITLEDIHLHGYKATVTPPTCTEQGYTTYTCTLCGDSYVGDYADATGHSYENGICIGCGEKQSLQLVDGFDEVSSIQGGDSRLVDAHDTVSPLILENLTLFENCKITAVNLFVTGTVVDNNGTNANDPTIEDDEMYTFDLVVLDASSVKAGQHYTIKRTYTLTVLGSDVKKNAWNTFDVTHLGITVGKGETLGFGSSNSTLEIFYLSKCVTTKLRYYGHNTTTGDTTLRLRTGTNLPVGVEGYKIDCPHQYVASVTPPTCTEQGYTTYTCTLCGDSCVGDYVEALGHSFEGKTCTVCGFAKLPYQRLTYFTVDVQTGDGKIYKDNAVLYLPANYTPDGEPVKLVIYCKQGASQITASSNPIEDVGFYNYLLSLGYAILGVDGVPDAWRDELGICERAVGNPVAVQGTERAYDYVVENYNIASDGCFISGYSQGGHYAQNVIDLTDIPILAAAEQSPVCSMQYHQWDLNATVTVNGTRFTKGARLNVARIYGFPTFTTNAELLALAYDPSLVEAYDPWVRNSQNVYTGFVQSGNLWYLPDGTSLDDITMTKTAKCPVKIWCAEDDTAISADVMKVFVKAIQNAGGIAEISVASSGGHGFFQNQAAVGTFTENGKTYKTLPIAVEIAQWFEQYGGYGCKHIYSGTTCTICGAEYLDLENYRGKVISILGDSISSFKDYVPAGNATFYPKHDVQTVEDTWWMQLITRLDAQLGVNESWSGSYVLNTIDGNSGNKGEDAAMASVTRIQNLGSNGTPDVIVFFGGTNDIAFGSSLGSFDPVSAPTEVNLTATKWTTYADAYVAAIMRLQHYYPRAQIVAILPTINQHYYDNATLEKYNAVMRSVCDHYGVACVDLVAAGYTEAMLGDVTHPNAAGMDFITEVVMKKLSTLHMHKHTAAVTPPTCTEQGYTTYTCACGDSYVSDYVEALGHTYSGTTCTICGGEHPETADYTGKVISILSASTSTFAGYIPVADGFNLAHRARYPQDNLLTDVNETWWMQLINDLGAKLGINDSWAGSQVLNTSDTNSGDLGPDACMASLTRIQNLGANGTPDLILFYGGGNDMGRGVTLGSFDPTTAPTEADLTAIKWDSFADAYVAAIMRLQYFYPDAEIVVISSFAMPSYVTAAKLDKYGPVIAAICDHYGVKRVSLRDCGVTYDMLPDNIHPNAEGMDHITNAVLEYLTSNCDMEPGEHAVHTVTHRLANAQASLHYYKGVSRGRPFVETVTGEAVSVFVTMGGMDITDTCYSDGVISIPEVTGDLVITAAGAYNCDGHLQQLPKELCAGVNLWTALEPENIYYTVDGWGNTAAGTTWSITFPVQPGDRIWATSLGAYPGNGSSANGVRVTWFGENGVLASLDRNTVYAEFAEYGYITAPEGAVALNLPMTNNQAHYAVYILSAGHHYTDGLCTVCGAVDITAYAGKVISVMGDSISTFAGYIPVADGFNLAHRTRYPDISRIPDVTDVNQTWWMQVVNELDAKLGINDSWAGSCIYWGDNMTTKNADTGEKAAMASLTRIQNLGSNGTPDVIFLYGGGNDKAKGVKVGTFDPVNVPAGVDLTAAKWDSFADSCVAAIMRMRHYYPDTEIVVLMSIAGAENDYIRVMREICEHFDVPFLFLNEHRLTSEMHPDGSHPNCEGMDVITDAILNVLAEECDVVPGENEVYSVTHELTNAQASLHYYKGVSRGRPFVETVTGEAVSVSVTMGGVDITDTCYSDGVISIPEVTGDLVITAAGIYNCDGHLQQLPEELCAGVNLWTALEPENIYYTVDGWGLFSSQPDVHSVTFPVQEGERIWATSFGKTSAGTGTRITWFSETGVLETVARDIVYAEFSANGYITVPAGAVALNVPMGDASKDREIYLLDREHIYGDWVQHIVPTCDTEGRDVKSCTICSNEIYRDTRISGDTDKIQVSNPVPEDYFAGKRLLLIGDSITCGVGLSDPSLELYGNLVGKTLGMTVTNKAISGSGFCTGGRMRANDTLTEANVRNADLITIMLGINDFNWAVKDGYWSGRPGYYDESDTYYQLGEFGSDDTSTFYGALKAWCEKITELKQIEGFEDKEFVFITPLISSWNASMGGAKSWNQDKTNVHGHTIRQYCTAIMEVCAAYSIPVFDANMFSGLYYNSAEDNNVGVAGGDGVHINAAGHALLADSLTEFLLEGYSYEERTVTDCGHSYETAVTDPTCTEAGYTTYRCPECHYSYKGDYTDVLGHTSTAGLCTVCGHDCVEVTVDNGTLTVTCEDMEPDTLIWLVSYDGNGKFVAMKRVILGETLTLPAGEKWQLMFVDSSWTPLRTYLEF